MQRLDSKTSKDPIVVFRIGSLGDTLVSVPAFHAIREQFQDKTIVLLTNTPVDGGVKAALSYQVLMGSGLIDDYIVYSLGLLGFRRIVEIFRVITLLRRLKPTLVIYLMPRRRLDQKFRDVCFFALASIFSIKGLSIGKNKVHTSKERTDSELNYEPEAKRLLRVVDENFETRAEHYSIELDNSEKNQASELIDEFGLESGCFIAISVGAKVDVKDWGHDRWLQMLAILHKSMHGKRVACFGSADESERSEFLIQSWPSGGTNFCGKLSPRISAAVLERAAIFVGHDSGPMHLAASVGIPVVSVFSSRDMPGIWYPYRNEDNVFYTKIHCAGCRRETCEDLKKECIRSIRPADVANRVRDICLNVA
jgi:heptosyltransferase III